MEVRAIEAEHPGNFKKIWHLVKGENYRKSFQVNKNLTTSISFIPSLRESHSSVLM